MDCMRALHDSPSARRDAGAYFCECARLHWRALRRGGTARLTLTLQMGTLFRSQPMCLGQVFLQAETAYDTVSALGELVRDTRGRDPPAGRKSRIIQFVLASVPISDCIAGRHAVPRRACVQAAAMTHAPQLNPTVNAFQRKFVNEIRKCEEMLRQLR